MRRQPLYNMILKLNKILFNLHCKERERLNFQKKQTNKLIDEFLIF